VSSEFPRIKPNVPMPKVKPEKQEEEKYTWEEVRRAHLRTEEIFKSNSYFQEMAQYHTIFKDVLENKK